MNLHDFAEDFRDLIFATAQYKNIREVYVEKDYWVTLILKRLSAYEKRGSIVFKGGTSLSKGFGLIRRFSEDIDLAVIRGTLSNAATERLVKETSKYLTTSPFVDAQDSLKLSKHGMIRRTLHSYPKLSPEKDYGPVKENILLEINCFGSPVPYSSRPIQSFISEFLISSGQGKVITKYGLESFEVYVLDLKRTFVGKILALSYASFADENTADKEVRARVRHFYDLTEMMRQEEIEKFLASEDFEKLLDLTRSEETLSSRVQWADRK